MNNSISKFIILTIALLGIHLASTAKASQNENVLSFGPEYNSSEKINLNTLNQSTKDNEINTESGIMNFKADSIKDTKRKSFHSLRNIEELHDEDMIVIQ